MMPVPSGGAGLLPILAMTVDGCGHPAGAGGGGGMGGSASHGGWARVSVAAVALSGTVFAGCGATLPYDVSGYETRCVRLNLEPIPPHKDDRHHGFKNVYACNVEREQLRANHRPFPEGTLIVKESRRPNESFVWLIALARKHGGAWKWDEYTRNFSDDDLHEGFASADVCTGCHADARADDWIFTRYQGQ